MKMLFIFILALCGNLLQAQTTTIEPTGVKLTPGVQPPSVVTNRFASDYPNVNPMWAEQEGSYSAEYRVEDTNMGRIVRYDNNGNLLSLENELHNDAYPASIGQYYVKKYPHEKYKVWSYQDAAGNKNYYASHGQEPVWFDKAGKYTPAKTTRKKSERNR